MVPGVVHRTIHMVPLMRVASDHVTELEGSIDGVQVSSADLAGALERWTENEGWLNLRSGSSDAWREVFPEADREGIWRLTPPALAERFGWRH